MWGVHSDEPQLELVGNEMIAIGWSEMGDLTAVPDDREVMKARVALTYPGWTPPRVRGLAGTLLSFRHLMQIGDLVVYPDNRDSTLNFGRIASDYFHDASAPVHHNRRRVQWLRVGIPRSAFPLAARNEVGAAITVFRVKRHEALFTEFIESGVLPNVDVNGTGLAELRAIWETGAWRVQRAEAGEVRLAALPELQGIIERFVSGHSGLQTFRQESHDFAFAHPHWGFKGFGQMLLNQIAKIAESSGTIDKVTAELREILAVPADEAAAEEALANFVTMLSALGEDGVKLGVGKPAPGRAPLVASYFWEAQDRERWPVFYPKSRDELAKRGLFQHPGDPVAAYRAFRTAVFALRDDLGGDVWDIESLLWTLPKVEKPKPPERSDTARALDAGVDIYEAYRLASPRLYFLDRIVTTVLLSLWAKPFVILSGISGTGKTQIALGLARALESASGTASAELPKNVEQPVDDESNIYLTLSPAARERGRFYVGAKQALAFELPELGQSVKFPVRLPGGDEVTFRLNNIDLAAGGSRRLLLFGDRRARIWLHDETNAGDVLHLAFDDRRAASANVIAASAGTGQPAPPRYEVVPVRADWNDAHGLLGYWNPILDEYSRTPFLDLALRALRDPDRPYFAILDEMNLARVEYYFSDVLSAMESGEAIPLRGDFEDEGEGEYSCKAGMAQEPVHRRHGERGRDDACVQPEGARPRERDRVRRSGRGSSSRRR